LGMGVGMGNIFGSQMQQVGQPMANPQPVAPPPPVVFSPYHVYINGSQQGPFDANTLKSLVDSHVMNRDTLVWKQGMAQWGKAGDQPDLQQFFAPTTPPPPPVPPMP